MKILSAVFSLVLLFFIAACTDSLVGEDVESESLTILEGDIDAASAFGKRSGEMPAPGEASIVYSFPVNGSAPVPEGIAFDRRGNMYVSNRSGSGGEYTHNTIEKITSDGSHSVLVDLGSSCPGTHGLLGLTTDPIGNVYAAFDSCTPNHGVVKVSRTGHVTHLAGSEAMIVPNSLTFDSRGNLYVTDSFGSAVYRYDKRASSFAPWVIHEYLAPGGPPIPYGANGIAFKAPNDLYVANTTGGFVVHIPILPDGAAGIPGQILPTGPLFWMFLFPDGLTIDTDGMLYAALPPAGTPPPPGVPDPGIPLSPVVKMDPSTGLVTPVVEPFLAGFPGSEKFDTATSLAFGNGPFDRKSVFVISGDMFRTPIGSGPVVTQVRIGVPGMMGQ